jgi:beta-lactamase regulating signal transducer with metallopeptidase domain
MIAWLTDTLIMTGAIMALILLIRRPVGRWFGPGAAYALWALPMIRLFLPPLVLPETIAATHAAETLAPTVEPVAQALPASMLAEPAAAPIAATPVAFDVPWVTLLVVAWLGGAVLFLAYRAFTYRAMRRELLQDARSVGRSGRVRIVESPAVDAPVAFGMFDRVVALPQGFLAGADSDVSDFAITHELEHHAGNDLIANIAVQPLFALHWFNPLAWLAWRALRSDQEAACDSRVMSGRSRRERERYGRLIASFAAGPKFALAAPMAGPLKGDKPIIHRLKALVRNDVPERHRLLGRSLFAASVIAVPLTATVTYAAVEEPEAPAAPEAPRAPHAPAATAPDVPEVADAPEPAEAPDESLAPDAPQAVRTRTRHATIIEHRNIATDADNARAAADAERANRDAERAGRDAERMVRNSERMARDAMRRAPKVEQTVSADGNVQTIRIVSNGNGTGPVTIRKMVIDSSCPADKQPARAVAVAGSTVSETRVCTGVPDTSRHVAIALRSARASVAANARIPSNVRSEILSDLDEQIASAHAETD